MKKGKRRGVSLGTIVMIVITVATLVLSLRIIPRIMGETSLMLDGAQQVVSALTNDLNLPELRLSDIPILSSVSSGASSENTPVPTLDAVLGSNVSQVPQNHSEPNPSPTPALKKVVFQITAAGSFAADNDIRQSVYSKESDTYDFAPMLSYIKDAVTGDVALFTLENLIDKSKMTNLNTSDKVLDAVREAGFDVVSIGHERAMDLGFDALKNTLSTVTSKGFSVIGAFDDSANAQNGLMMNINGAQVAFLHYQEEVSSKGKTNIKKAGADYALPVLDEDKITQDIASLRQRGANIVIVSVHWGSSNRSTVTKAQKAAAQKISDAGADVILGAHSQALQPVEYLVGNRSDGTQKQTLVAYSMGALMTSLRNTANISAVLLHLTISYDPSADLVTFDKVACSPIYFWRYKEDGQYLYRPVISSNEPPENMNKDQVAVMEKTLKRTREILQGSPVIIE